MNRNLTISAALTAVGVAVAFAPPSALAASTLLSGYGGPGAGEQVIVGATLLNVPSGGSGGSGGSGAGSRAGSVRGGVSPAGATHSSLGVQSLVGSTGEESPTSGAASLEAGVATGPGARGAGSHKPGASSRERGAGAGSTSYAPASRGLPEGEPGAGSGPLAYPGSQGSAALASSTLGLTGGDLALVACTLLGLGLLATVTIRLARLQR